MIRDNIDKILYDGEIDILYSSKSDWFELENGKQNWTKSSEKITFFWKTIRKLLSSDAIYNGFIDFSGIAFPMFEQTKILDGMYLKDDNFFYQNGDNNFNEDISFMGCIFYGEAEFNGLKFMQKAFFDNATFKVNANFTKTLFKGEVSFKKTSFQSTSSFQLSRFNQKVSFNQGIFIGVSRFRNSKFNKAVAFRKTIFKGKVFFWSATFRDKFDGWSLQGHDDIDFTSSSFFGKTLFWDTHFRKTVNFSDCEFYDNVTFKNADLHEALFNNTKFKTEADFSYTEFQKGVFRNAVFYNLNFNQAIFHNVILTEIKGFNKKKEIATIKAMNIANRETARIIKNFSKKKSNTSEMNKFYAIELHKIEHSLSTKENRHIKDLLILKIFKYTSQYSQNYLLPFFWLILSSSIFTYFIVFDLDMNFKEQFLIFSHMINPINLISGNHVPGHEIESLYAKLLSAYFIYHIVISIKQRTGK